MDLIKKDITVEELDAQMDSYFNREVRQGRGRKRGGALRVIARFCQRVSHVV